MVFLQSCQTLFLRFPKKGNWELFSCLRDEKSCRGTGACIPNGSNEQHSWQQLRSSQVHRDWTNLPALRSVLPGQGKAPLWTSHGNLLPFQHFWCFCGQALTQMALKKCNSTKTWGPGTWNIRSLFNRNDFVRYVRDNNVSTMQLWLCQNWVKQVLEFFLTWPWIASFSVILGYTKNLNTDVKHPTFRACFCDVLVGICVT